MKTNTFWIILFSVIVVLSIGAMLFLNMPQAVEAQIFVDGELIETINLIEKNEPIEVIINNADAHNVVEAENGRVRMSKANCGIGICTAQGWRSSGVVPIVCLPNRVVVRLVGNTSNDIDGVVG